MRHEGANVFVFGCEAYTGGKSFLFLSAEVVDSVLTRLHHACLPPPDIYAHKRQITHGSGCQETSMIMDATLPSVAFLHYKSRQFLVTALSTKDSNSPRPLLFLLLTNVLSAFRLVSPLCAPLAVFLLKEYVRWGLCYFRGFQHSQSMKSVQKYDKSFKALQAGTNTSVNKRTVVEAVNNHESPELSRAVRLRWIGDFCCPPCCVG